MTEFGPDLCTRREFLWKSGGGFGALALAHLLAQTETHASPSTASGKLNAGLHHPARAKNIIQLFMNGGVSQMDTFDYKPELGKQHGQPFDPGAHVEAATSVPGRLMTSPFEFKQHGQSGRWVSSVFPHMATCVDDMAFVMSMVSKTNVHGPGSYMMNTGFLTPGFPCLGAWVSYALGHVANNLPSFIVLPDPRGLPYNQKGNFSAGFLPGYNQGTLIQAHRPDPVRFLKPPNGQGFVTPASEKAGRALLRDLNERHLERSYDPLFQERIASYELAAQMQLSAPEALDLSSESPATRALYGLDNDTTNDFGRRCLLARRLVERGVRFVQVWSGAGGPTNNWDNHADIPKELPPMAAATDQPIAALLRDLKARGMLEETLVIWSTEFGRMPFTQGSTGRDHNGGTFVSWLAGAGIRGGTAVGESDPWSWRAALDPAYCYDFHATILHLLGIDHEKLTFRHNGIDRRLTDVHGRVIRQILQG